MDNDDTIDSIQIPKDETIDNSADPVIENNSQELTSDNIDQEQQIENESDTDNDNSSEEESNTIDDSDDEKESEKESESSRKSSKEKDEESNSRNKNTSRSYENNITPTSSGYQYASTASGSYGPKVDTGGKVKTGIISKILSSIK